MTIYYLMIEAIPCRNNPESKEFGGAFVNCWVKASTQKEALKRVQEYIKSENWMFIKTEILSTLLSMPMYGILLPEVYRLWILCSPIWKQHCFHRTDRRKRK